MIALASLMQCIILLFAHIRLIYSLGHVYAEPVWRFKWSELKLKHPLT
jgi:hypothetical protein